MGVSGVDSGCGDGGDAPIGIHHGVIGELPVKVPTLGNHNGIRFLGKFCRLGQGFLERACGFRGAKEYREFRHVGGHNVHMMSEFDHGLFRIRVEKPITAGSDHHRVEHDQRHGVFRQPLPHARHNVCTAEHADFHGVNGHVRDHSIELFPQE